MRKNAFPPYPTSPITINPNTFIDKMRHGSRRKTIYCWENSHKRVFRKVFRFNYRPAVRLRFFFQSLLSTIITHAADPIIIRLKPNCWVSIKKLMLLALEIIFEWEIIWLWLCAAIHYLADAWLKCCKFPWCLMYPPYSTLLRVYKQCLLPLSPTPLMKLCNSW